MNKFLQTLVVFCYCLFLSHHSNAQQWKHYSSKYRTSCFLVAKDSTLWVGTAGGVIHYDKNYKVIESNNHSIGPDSNITSLVEDIKGNIIAQTPYPPYIYLFDGHSWVVSSKINYQFQFDKPIIFDAYFDGEKPWRIKTWMSFNKGNSFMKLGLDSIYNQNEIEKLRAISFYNSQVAEDDSNNIWVKIHDNLYSFNGKKWKIYNLSSLWRYDDLVIDNNGKILFLTYNGIIRFDPKDASYILIKTEYPSKLLKTNSGRILVAVEKQILELTGDTLTEYLTDNSLGHIITFSVDLEDRLIICTNPQNYIYDKNKLISLDLPKLNLYGNYVNAIQSDVNDNHGIFMNGGGKLLRLNDLKNEIEQFPFEAYIMAGGNGNDFWCAASETGVLNQYDGNKWTTHILSENDYRIYKIVRDQNNYIWCKFTDFVKHIEKIFWFDGSVWNSLEDGEYFHNIAPKAGGGIWMTNSNLLKSFDGSTMTSYPSNAENKLPKSPILLKTSNNGTLWIVSSPTSIHKFDGKVAQEIQFPKTLRFSYYYDAFYIDKDENLWVGNARNLYKYDGRTWKIFNAENDPINIKSISQSNDGRIWVGTNNGIYVMANCGNTALKNTIHLNNTIVLESKKVQLEVKAESGTSFEWQLSKDKGITWKNISNFDTNYQHYRTKILTINSANLSQNGYIYRCQIANECNTVLSDTIVLTVKQCPQIPQISLQPKPQSVIEKNSVQFSVNASGSSNYQWEVSADKGVSWKAIPIQDTSYVGQQSNLLNLLSSKISLNGNQYRCVIKNECHTIYSDAVILAVEMILGNEALIEHNSIAYPNPSSDYIRINAPKKSFSVTIINNNGVVVQHLENQSLISVKELSNGIYFLILVTDKEKLTTKINVFK